LFLTLCSSKRIPSFSQYGEIDERFSEMFPGREELSSIHPVQLYMSLYAGLRLWDSYNGVSSIKLASQSSPPAGQSPQEGMRSVALPSLCNLRLQWGKPTGELLESPASLSGGKREIDS
jgi:hypothetical protein